MLQGLQTARKHSPNCPSTPRQRPWFTAVHGRSERVQEARASTTNTAPYSSKMSLYSHILN